MTLQYLGKVFAQTGRPLYLALAECLVENMEQGFLKPGDKLPTHRDLAKQLGVTTGTVTRAYQVLVGRGLLSGEVGRGTFVRERSLGSARHDFGCSPGRQWMDLAYNLPPPIPGKLESEVFESGLKALAHSPELVKCMHYHYPQRDPRILQAGVEWLRRCGLEASTEELLALGGAQSALFLALQVLAKPGEEVLCEGLCYPGFRLACETLHLRLTGLPMDEEGILPEAFEAACARGPKALYLVPTLHNPTTATLGPTRRQQVVALARRHHVPLLEDDLHALLTRQVPRPLAADYPEGGWYLATTDKLLAPAARCCFLRVPGIWREELERRLLASQWMSPPLGLALVAGWIEDGSAWRLVEGRRQEARERLGLARECLEGLDWRGADAAYHLWLRLPSPWRGETFQKRLEEAGVAVTPAEAFAAGSALPQAVRLCLGGAPDQPTLRRALQTVAQVLRAGQRPERTVL